LSRGREKPRLGKKAEADPLVQILKGEDALIISGKSTGEG
jgi:hypothetical protein